MAASENWGKGGQQISPYIKTMHFLNVHVTHAKLLFSVSKTAWRIQQKRGARVDLKSTYKTSELKTLSSLRATPFSLAHLRSSCPYWWLPILSSNYPQDCFSINVLNICISSELKHKGNGTWRSWLVLFSFTFNIIQNIFIFIQVRNVAFHPTVIYLQEKQRLHHTSSW